MHEEIVDIVLEEYKNNHDDYLEAVKQRLPTLPLLDSLAGRAFGRVIGTVIENSIPFVLDCGLPYPTRILDLPESEVIPEDYELDYNKLVSCQALGVRLIPSNEVIIVVTDDNHPLTSLLELTVLERGGKTETSGYYTALTENRINWTTACKLIGENTNSTHEIQVAHSVLAQALGNAEAASAVLALMSVPAQRADNMILPCFAVNLIAKTAPEAVQIANYLTALLPTLPLGGTFISASPKDLETPLYPVMTYPDDIREPPKFILGPLCQPDGALLLVSEAGVTEGSFTDVAARNLVALTEVPSGEVTGDLGYGGARGFPTMARLLCVSVGGRSMLHKHARMLSFEISEFKPQSERWCRQGLAASMVGMKESEGDEEAASAQLSKIIGEKRYNEEELHSLMHLAKGLSVVQGVLMSNTISQAGKMFNEHYSQ